MAVQRFGSYEVLAKIGEGGMGEVYRARDIRLHRDVAIKVLPPLLARDPDRIARLEQEARAAAALNAPGIVAVHDIGTHTPSGAGHPLMFVVMELLEGETLRARIEAGAIPPRKAAEYAAQIASALGVAHARGIVHRDLKPENLFLTKDGRIKILDFGLAKEIDTVVASGSLATGIANTAAGTVLGTVGYMAPEQVRGEPAEARSDIFALGATLYEMLTARRAFSGGSPVETMNAILTQDPPEIAADISAATPGALHAILSRCLEKRPEDRFHSAHDLALALQAAGSGRATTSSVEAVVRTRSWTHVVGGVSMAAVAVGAVALTLILTRRSPAAVPPVTSLRQLTDLPGAEIDPDISPDGRQILYASAASGNTDLYLLRVGGGRAINLTHGSPGDDVEGTFSPDGERIAFRSDRDGGGLFVMGATGESVRRATSSGFNPSWSPDGTKLAFATEGIRDAYSRITASELWTVDLASGKTTKMPTGGDAVQPAWSPGGSRIAYWSNTLGQRDIKTIPAAGGSPVAVTNDPATDWAPEWSPDGKWLYFISDRGGSPNVWRVAIDEQSGATRGSPEAITNGVRALASARFSRDGTRMAVASFDRMFELSLYGFDPAKPGPPVPKNVIRSASLGWCAPSNDASWLACTARTGQEDLVLLRSDGSETRRLTDDPGKDRIATWSPDGRTLAFMSTRTGGWELWAIEADGSSLRQLTDLKQSVSWGVWAPDRTQMALTASTGDPGLWFVDPSRTTPADAGQFIGIDPRSIGGLRANTDTWSSDGALIAGGLANRDGDPMSIGVWDARTRTLLRHFELPLVRSTSLDVTFVPGTHLMLAYLPAGLSLVDAGTGAVRTILPLKPPFECRISADGRTLLVERARLESDLWLMEMGQSTVR